MRANSLPGGRVRLSFEPVEPDPALAEMSVEEAQAVLTVFHAAVLSERPEIRIIPPSRLRLLDEVDGKGWERHLRERFLSRFGGALLSLPETWEHSRLYQALKLSPRYMGAGVREAAAELFSSPVFLASVCLSVVVYFGAWLNPEPLFSKAFAVTLTAALALTVGMLEVANLALACLRLYRESEAARTQKELDAASEHFGKSVGGTMLRVMVMVASMGVAKTAPTVPHGGLGALLGSPMHAVEGGLAVGAAATATVVADGSLILSGVALGEVATHVCGGMALCATMNGGAGGSGSSAGLSTRYGPPHTRANPPHNEAIEKDLASREATEHSRLRKNKAQVDAKDSPLLDPKPVGGTRFRRPDASSVRPDGVRHNTNYVSNLRDLKRELEAFEAMRRADPKAIHELYLLDGTLVRRYVPAGVKFP
ncbi:hypothetical protein [Hyalangium sp.]|uniref:hypothetical protein n=1 Tax=Hyalangium sp. TaxID=2028555 RepID=UPI002D7531BF|nr:hypothetical protein [Hyalangium sp.]HYI00206.1 hypothetical protein [Hyalangium sp.]